MFCLEDILTCLGLKGRICEPVLPGMIYHLIGVLPDLSDLTWTCSLTYPDFAIWQTKKLNFPKNIKHV